MAGTFTVTAEDAYGNTTPAYAGTVKFTSSDAQAVLPSSATLVNGVGSSGATPRTAGAVADGDRHVQPRHHRQPGGHHRQAGGGERAERDGALSIATAGTAFSVTVTVLDPYGNTAIGYRGTVHFTSRQLPQAVLPANYTFTSADGGVHTFTNGVTLKTTGARTVTATDKATGSITGGASVMVAAAAAMRSAVADTGTAGAANGATPGPVVGDGSGGAAAGDAMAAAGRGRVNVTLGDMPGGPPGHRRGCLDQRSAGLRQPRRGAGRGAGRLGQERRRELAVSLGIRSGT